MATSLMSETIHHLRRTALRDGAGLTDADLLDRFVREGDGGALAALAQRHASMVWGVCCRILGSRHDAEDAFQATFLVLVRKAASIQHKELLANWLYGVAQQTALRSRAAAAKRRSRERQVIDMPEAAQREHGIEESLAPILDEELSRLPSKYRSLIILCDLQSKTRKEVAGQLACPEGTVAGRLARARALLAKRLARRGITVSGGALAALLANQAASAAPAPVLTSTIQAATLFAAGHATADGLSASAVALAEGVLHTMWMTKFKWTTMIAAAFILLAMGSGLWFNAGNGPVSHVAAANPVQAQEFVRAKAEQPKDGAVVKGKIGAVDVENRKITLVITMFDRKSNEATEKEMVFDVTKDTAIIQDGVKTKLDDLKRGFPTTLKVDQKNALSITVEGNSPRVRFKSYNSDRNTITVVAGRDMSDKIYHLLKTTTVITANGKSGKIQDIEAGSDIVLTLSVLGDNTVIRIQPVPMEKKKRGE
jgi:RNA polymerase sigma factor (sigma-70 family)